MERFIQKLDSGPDRFGENKLLKALPKSTRSALKTFREQESEKKMMITVILMRFYKALKKYKFPKGTCMVRNGFFLYGGQVIHKIFDQVRDIIDPKIADAMMMVPSSDFDGQLLMKFTKDGRISRDGNISKHYELRKFLNKLMKYAMEPFTKHFKLTVDSRTPFTIDLIIVGKKHEFKYAEIHASNAYYTKSGERMKQTKCCVRSFRPLFGLPVLDTSELFYDQLFALDSMLTGDDHRKKVRMDKCQSRFVRLTFLYDYMMKKKIRVPLKAKKLIKTILYRMDKRKYQKHFKSCSVKIH